MYISVDCPYPPGCSHSPGRTSIHKSYILNPRRLVHIITGKSIVHIIIHIIIVHMIFFPTYVVNAIASSSSSSWNYWTVVVVVWSPDVMRTHYIDCIVVVAAGWTTSYLDCWPRQCLWMRCDLGGWTCLGGSVGIHQGKEVAGSGCSHSRGYDLGT